MVGQAYVIENLFPVARDQWSIGPESLSTTKIRATKEVRVVSL